MLRQNDMNEREVRELAAILIEEHGRRAVAVAARRRAQYASRPCSEIFQLWNSIGTAAAQLLRRRRRARRAR
ncbi:MAG TPA: hypothetical protein VJ770_30640 [Stellaceae bacterium]|nr:hypothetical protein [Stellaceae bacterium]